MQGKNFFAGNTGILKILINLSQMYIKKSSENFEFKKLN